MSTDFHAGLDDDNGEEDDDEEAGPGSTHPMGATGSQGSLSPEPVSTGNPSVPPTRIHQYLKLTQRISVGMRLC